MTNLVAGHYTIKKGHYYIVLNLRDANGKRKPKWIATGLREGSTKKEKKNIEKEVAQLLLKAQEKYSQIENAYEATCLFSDFLMQWLEVIRNQVKITTFSGYQRCVQSVIGPYFEKTKIRLIDLKGRDLQLFYQSQLKRVKATSVIHYHAIIHRALEHAVRMELIAVNPADNVETPRRTQFIAQFYNVSDLSKLFLAAKGTKLEFAVIMAAFYGLRRSEVVGLKWSAIDFENNTITIKHTVVTTHVDGQTVTVESDTTKNSSSYRTLPLLLSCKKFLLTLKEKQEKQRRLCGNVYSEEYLDYIYVDELGVRIQPNYVSRAFQKLLRKNNLKHIRFHDLRHSCASLLLANGVPMKYIQEWLGHSDFSTTANIYAHLDYKSKMVSANAVEAALPFPI